MGLFDALTGDAAARAAKNNMYAIGVGEQQGGNALLNSGNAALGYLLGAPGQMGALQVTDRGYDQGRQDLAKAQEGTQAGYLALGQLYQPETQMGQGALTRYMNATGANGAAGAAQAAQDFTAAPGYQYALNQALGSVQRSAAARGGLAGGNATQDILNTATGLANQGYQQYINNLGNASGYYTQGLAGQAGALQSEAQTNNAYGNALAGMDTGRGAALAGALGSAAGVQTGIGQGFAGLANNATNALVQNNNNLANAQTQASGNLLGSILGIGKSALSGLGSLGSFNPFSGL